MSDVDRNVQPGAELRHQFHIVVDLAVVGEDRAVRRHHRLVARGRQIDDGEPAMGESDTPRAIQPVPLTIWSAVRDELAHHRQDTIEASNGARRKGNNSGYSAQISPPR